MLLYYYISHQMSIAWAYLIFNNTEEGQKIRDPFLVRFIALPR